MMIRDPYRGCDTLVWCRQMSRLLYYVGMRPLRTRLVDLYLREHITLLWVIEGGKYLRVHDGVVYFYHEDPALTLARQRAQ